MTNLVQFPGLGLSFEINRVALSIGGFNIYWYGVCIAFGICLALVFAFRHSIEFGVDPDSMVDVILIGIVLGIVSARAYYVAMAPFKYESIWEMIAIRDGGLAIYGGIIGGFLFGGLACKWRGVPVLPMFDLTAMGFLLGQGCGRWGNFFNQEAFGCNTTLPWGMFSETTRAYLMGSTVTAQSGVTIDPNLPVHPTFLYESIWCFVGFLLLFRYIKKRKFNGDIALRYMIWYGAGRFWIEALRTDSLMLVPSIGLRASQLVAGIAVVVGVAAEIYFTHKFKDKPLMVKPAMTADNKAAINKLSKGKTVIGLMTDTDTELLASSPRKLFVERTEAYNAEVKRTMRKAERRKNKKSFGKRKIPLAFPSFFCYTILAAWCGRLKWPSVRACLYDQRVQRKGMNKMYAIIVTGGKQYRVEQGDIVYIEKLDVEADSEVKFDQVLAIGEEGSVKVGAPVVEGATVTAKVIKNGKGKKLNIITYRAKKHSARRMGHRQPFTKVEITAING